MRQDDERIEKCGAWAAGLLMLGACIAVIAATAIIGYLTDGDIRA